MTIEHKEQKITRFESQIESLEEHLFGVTLYYDTTPKILRWSQKSSYNNIKRRIEQTLLDAKELLEKVKDGQEPVEKLQEFHWTARWAPMEEKIKLLLDAYHTIFPDRPMNKLSNSEVKELREMVKRML